jgi:hypothetical protein
MESALNCLVKPDAHCGAEVAQRLALQFKAMGAVEGRSSTTSAMVGSTRWRCEFPTGTWRAPMVEWISQQVQLQPIFLAYMDAFLVLMLISPADVPLAMILRKTISPARFIWHIGADWRSCTGQVPPSRGS